MRSSNLDGAEMLSTVDKSCKENHICTIALLLTIREAEKNMGKFEKARGTKDANPIPPNGLLKVAPRNRRGHSMKNADLWVETVPVLQQALEDPTISASALVPLQWMTAVLLSTAYLTELACSSWTREGQLQSVEHDVEDLINGSKSEYVDKQQIMIRVLHFQLANPGPVVHGQSIPTEYGSGDTSLPGIKHILGHKQGD
ncbi:hypothetical protein H0H93_001384 [Arthromyces matolae]|nr:hypothetical protein H0H93_001384 [Arthromyces matolae]